mgnify:FL=1|tara:strand:- start:20 stop:451 length:432 start_codon:yes stop_codon:yes gene_type:complete
MADRRTHRNGITQLRKDDVFVFGSNEGGNHGAGAAKTARQLFNMPFGKSYGHYGNCFAIPTKDEYIQTLELSQIEDYVRGFLAYAKGKKRVTFLVTTIGTGLGGLLHSQIAPMFKGAPKNCQFDDVWEPYLGEEFTYWGSYGG